MGKVENKIQNIMLGQPFPNAALVLQHPGYQHQPCRQLVLTDVWMDIKNVLAFLEMRKSNYEGDYLEVDQMLTVKS